MARGRAHFEGNFCYSTNIWQTQAGADSINLHDPRVQTAITRPSVMALTTDNTDQVGDRSKKNRNESRSRSVGLDT
ncbi:MAG: hypothetical protein ACREX9_11310, partial [Gammaproteobacteria bacterium]